jgi:hypothetical protein
VFEVALVMVILMASGTAIKIDLSEYQTERTFM